MPGSILVTGGTGTLGSIVVQRLLAGNHDVRVLSRRDRTGAPYTAVTGDLRKNTGIAEAVAGADTVIHCATGPVGDVNSTRNLLAAAVEANVRHFLYISIVGVDRVPFRYYRAKLAAERVVENGGVPWTILRATQFHELVKRLCAGLAKPPVMPVPDIPCQPIDAAEVADRLVRLGIEAPAGRVPDIGGPKVHRMTDLARIYLRATGQRRRLLPIRLPGKVFHAYHAGGHLASDHADGSVTFAEFLDRA